MASTAAYNDKNALVYSPTAAHGAIPYALHVDTQAQAQTQQQQQQYVVSQMFSVPQQQSPAVPAPPVQSSSTWESPLFDCFAAPGHCCMAFILPCVNGAYAAHWINKSAALVGTFLFLMYTSAVVFASVSVDGIWGFVWGRRYIYDDEYYTDEFRFTVWDTIETVSSMLFVAAVVWLRRAVREFYRIPGSTINDCCASFWCSCCVLMQLSAHTERAKAKRADAATLPAYQAA